jgi:hypothetical protein
MIFFRAVKYLRYIFLARYSKGHGMHSPFIFDLVSRILWNKTDNDVVCSIEKVRKKLISDHRLIKISDLGSAKYRKTTNNRKVSEIARYSPVPSKYGQLLSNLAAEFGKPMILELGTSFGISTMYLASGSPETVIYTIEGSAEISEIASRNFTDTGMKNIKTLTGSFDEMLPVVFGGVLRYFDKIAEVSDTNTVIVIDDIYYSREMEEAWNEIKIDEKVSVTVDIFRMGIVFFRRGMSHQNYIVRH